ncbi:MAG: type II toxin-antitoxin system PemK/MazF family toxin [Candidatus Diapherotrites archaeon]
MEPILKVKQRDVILLLYPFSDGAEKKLRPCIVISNNKHNLKREDVIVVPLTTNVSLTDYSFILTNTDLEKGNLIKESKVKIERIFSIKKTFVRVKIGSIKKEIHNKIVLEINELIKEN